MKDTLQATAASTAGLLATVRSSLEKVRNLLVGGLQSEETRAQLRQLELLEQLLLDQDARLASFDRVLEEFNYSVAHELCAPLRRISGFTREIVSRWAEVLGTEGVEYLHRILDSSQQMNELIDALMQISRLSHVELQRTQVDLSGLAEEISAELGRKEPERAALFVIQPRLATLGDAALLKMALGKLFDNAWKFSRDRQPCIIEFAALPFPDGATFYVRDNGVGFDPADGPRLYHPFQRLHDPDRYSGCGMGLTAVKRIIERHGGRVWAEGERDGGATFYFTLPGSCAVDP